MQLEPEEIQALRDIAHDLRGSTWVVKGFLELLTRHWDSYDAAKRKEMVLMASNNVERVEKAARDLDAWRAPASRGGDEATE